MLSNISQFPRNRNHHHIPTRGSKTKPLTVTMACCCCPLIPILSSSGFTGSINRAFKIRRSSSVRSRSSRPSSSSSSGSFRVVCGFLPVDPWAPNIASQSFASQLFAASLFPYLGFLYFITKSNTSPKLTLFGFYFLLAFVGATIPAGIYAKVHYGTSLSNVDWLHGGAESLLTLTNLFIVLGLREALRKLNDAKKAEADSVSAEVKEKQSSL